MNESNEESLFEMCPLLFRGKDYGEQLNLMCYGFECDDGWGSLLIYYSSEIEKLLCRMLTYGVLEDDLPLAFQVKEKFGSLRFYMEYPGAYSDDAKELICSIKDLVKEVQQEAKCICEVCGREGEMQLVRGRLQKTLCQEDFERLSCTD